MIRQGDWKLHLYDEDNVQELYHLKEDVGERHNLAEAYPEKAAALLQLLQNWLKETQAPIPKEKNPVYDASYEKSQQMTTGN